MELTMVKGLTEDAVKRLASLKTQIDQRFDTLNQQLADTKQDILELHTKFDEQRNLLLRTSEMSHNGWLVLRRSRLSRPLMDGLN
jgi:hypothetical protein